MGPSPGAAPGMARCGRVAGLAWPGPARDVALFTTSPTTKQVSRGRRGALTDSTASLEL